MTDISELYMSRCLDLAGNGKGNVAPNPMVGSVIVHDGNIIGEGYHRCFGEAHAEVNAIASVKDAALLRNSTLYVNLEPCSHYGKTPPCAELIIQKKIPRVVVACLDPYPEVAGRGVRMLRSAGVEVITGVMEREAVALNRFFLTAHKYHRPYVILKWAQSEDGFIDRKRDDVSEMPVVFSTPVTRMMVHKLRSEVQAIMVGTNTAILDNPSLTVRYWSGKSPVRILIDRDLRVPENYHLLDGTQQTFVFTKQSFKDIKYKGSGKESVKYVKIDDSANMLNCILTNLYKGNIHSLLVEGGAQLHRSFMEEGVWDEIIVETVPVRIRDGVESAFFYSNGGAQLVDRQVFPSDGMFRKRPSVVERYLNCEV
ncbi:MAG: bifunctional diaminohydroxyphosphoribosylaminopyrimidine deaminase/5-amino-6-(5-phosphoribosylamino)uracil reductase RibD [Tannerella sp.]|nr:bifunctional diaminohydroxyphosphoribosylaminopyrimidine deaminase/5-amino-6-(5-phosphoribosylamino)uracil reductase RibD [Tannerella sp.]